MATVIIIDDSKTSTKIIRTALESDGLTVIGEAANGEEGFLLYKELHPDIVTMDVTMPIMDGIEALSLIKREDSRAKVIMITAAGQKEKMVEAIKRGADEFILKPFEPSDLINTVHRLLEGEEEEELDLEAMFGGQE